MHTHPHSRLSIALVLSLALWWPALQGMLGGDVDPLAASLRWVAAFVVASVAVHILANLLEHYSADHEPATVETEDDPTPV